MATNVVLRSLTLLWALGLVGCEQPRIYWQELPDDVFVAGPAVAFEVVGKGTAKELALVVDKLPGGGQRIDSLELFKFVENRLQKVQFQIETDRLIGTFTAGERYLFHFPMSRSTIAKYTLFCRLQTVHMLFDPFEEGFLSNRLCPVILCPADPYFANELLDQFPVLRRFPNEFGEGELGGMRIEPIQSGLGFGNICDQCFGRNWGIVRIPVCERPIRCWTPQGPGPNTLGQVENILNREVVGAINAVAVHPTDSDVMYVGAVNGGIWRTNDATAANPNWANQTDNEQSMSIGALEFDPTDSTNQTLVAGIGRFSSLNRQGGSRIGLLRTTNGAAWTELDGGGTIDGLNISGIAPRGATIVLSANTADAIGNRGIWRSTDTGASFTQVSGAAASGLPTGPSFDLVGDPNDNTRLYTNAGGNGIYRSDDTGATWTKVSNAAMDGLIGGAGNIEIAAGTNQNVYVAIVRFRTLAGIFRSPDNGATWTALDLPQTNESGTIYGIHAGRQGNIHLSIAADPNDDNVVYIGGDRQPCLNESTGCRHPVIPRWPNTVGAADFSGRLFRIDASLAVGSQATPLTHSGTASGSSPHADSRDMDVRADGVLIEGDDGGIYRRTTPRSNAGDWFSMNGNLQTTEFHNISWDAVNNIVIGGAQDTGTPQQVNELDVTWQSVATADGGDVAVDDSSAVGQSVRYSSSQFLGNFRRRVYDSTNTLQSQVFLNLAVRPPAPIGNPPVPQFYTPIELNNVDATRLIVGAANSVYESLDQGNTVTEIGVGITANNNLGNDAIAYGATGNVNILYVGSGTQVFIRNAAAPAALTASATYPGTAAIVDISIDPGDPNTAFVADNANVFHTDDAGATWTDVTGNLGTLNAGTIRALAFRGSGIVAAGGGDLVAVGTDNGVYSAGATTFDLWAEHSCNLPNVPVYDLDYDPVDRVFVAGTFGRGAWVLHE